MEVDDPGGIGIVAEVPTAWRIHDFVRHRLAFCKIASIPGKLSLCWPAPEDLVVHLRGHDFGLDRKLGWPGSLRGLLEKRPR